jgi:hypothetical protein
MSHFTRTPRAEARPEFQAIDEKQSMDPTQPFELQLSMN